MTEVQRLAILARRFDLVQEYHALHVERMDLHMQLEALRTTWSATLQAGGGGGAMAACARAAQRSVPTHVRPTR